MSANEFGGGMGWERVEGDYTCVGGVLGDESRVPPSIGSCFDKGPVIVIGIRSDLG
jgi:hypothetical protein